MVTKRVSSKIANYINKPNQQQNQDRSQQVDEKVIADMAKGFLQAQSNLNNPSCTGNSQEVVNLLNKINYQLSSLQEALNVNNSNPGGQGSPSSQQTGESQQSQELQYQQGGQQSENSQPENDVSQELRNLFSMLLKNDNRQNNQINPNKGTNDTSSQNQRQGQSNSQNNRQNNSSIAVQTAAQVLAQAQYELSNELEASLNKLKQVISESEKIANKISSLLGEENSQSQ